MTVGFIGGSKSLDLEIQQYDSSVNLNGDKQITESTISNMADFLIDNKIGNQTVARELKQKPNSLDECVLVLTMIVKLPFFAITPNDFSRYDGRIMITRKVTMGLNDHKLIGIVGEQALKALKATQRTELPMLCISENASNAMLRHTKDLQKKKERVTYTPPARSYSPPRRLYTAPKITPYTAPQKIYYNPSAPLLRKQSSRGCCTIL